jgi:cytochrome c oxidase subunit 3
MSVILVFLLVVLGFAGWWLAHQRLMSKPWLEVGPDPVGGPERTGIPTQKIALGIFLAVVGALFALFASAYFMRMELSDWRPMPLPRIVWLNTGMLVLASVALECALAADRKRDAGTLRLSLVTAAVATLAFLAGQLVAWRDLAASGYLVTANPANSFFYMLTALHGLHILGGLVALARAAPAAWGAGDARRLRLRLELCVAYWHFLLFVWLGLLVLFAGWATDFIDICRQLLT